MGLKVLILLLLQINELILSQSTTSSSITTQNLLSNIKSQNCTTFSTSKDYWFTYNGTNSCYFISELYQRETYHHANHICMSKNATLVSIHNSTVNYLLSHRDSGYFSSSGYWIGLNSLTKRATYIWSDNSPVQFTNLTNITSSGDKIPTDIYEQGRCVSLKVGEKSSSSDLGGWFKDDCNEEHNFICERSIVNDIPVTPPPTQPGHCAPDWLDFANEKCIKHINGSMNFTEAKSTCINLGGEILSIHSEKEQDFVTALMEGFKTPYIGLRKKYFTSWRWDDQTPIAYTNWGSYETTYSTDCAVINTNITQPGKWIEIKCSDKYSVICQKNKDPANPDPGIKNKCKISGFENFIQFKNSCYYLMDSPSSNFTSFYGAEGNCEAMNGAHLLSIVDPFEQAFLKYIIKQNGKSDMYWIGLHSEVDSEKNVSQIFEWTDQWPIYLTAWDKDEPQFAGIPRAECVALHQSNSTWKTTLCDNRFAYICKTTTNQLPKMNSDKSGVCPQPNAVTDKTLLWLDLDRRSQYCFWFSIDSKMFSQLMSWSDSSFQCHRRKGTLVSIHSNHELMLLRTKLSESTHSGYYTGTWIGLTEDINGDYVWEDGTALDFTNWDPSESIVKGSPNPDSTRCIENSIPLSFWKSEYCSTKRYFICQIKKLYNNTSISHNSSTTLNTITKRSTTLGPIVTTIVKKISDKPIVSTYTTHSTPITTSASIKDKQNSNDSEDKLSKGAKFGIAFGVVGGIVLIIGITYFILKKMRPNSSIVTKFENSLYLNKRSESQVEPSIRWSKNT